MINRLEWDSGCFGYEVGTTSIGTEAFDYDEFIEEAKGYQLVYIFSEVNLIRVPLGIKKVDEKITFKKELRHSMISLQEEIRPIVDCSGKGAMLEHGVVDLIDTPINGFNQAFMDLALMSGEYSRFKTDERLCNKEFEKMYHSWAHNALMEDNQGFVFVKEGEVRGIMTLTSTQSRLDRINLLAVHPDSRRQGIGSALLNKALATGTESGSSALWVTTQEANVGAMLLYQKAGFEVMDACPVYH